MSKKLNIILTIIISLIACIGIVFTIIFINNPDFAKTKGTVTIELVDLDDKKVLSKDINFKEKDTLVSIVSDEFDNVLIENGMVITIEELTTYTINWSVYIWILVNGEYSMVGINDIELVDELIVTFKMEEYIPYE